MTRYRITPSTSFYSGTTWSVQKEGLFYWKTLAEGLCYEAAVDIVEKMIKHNGGKWASTDHLFKGEK